MVERQCAHKGCDILLEPENFDGMWVHEGEEKGDEHFEGSVTKGNYYCKPHGKEKEAEGFL